MIGGSFVRGVSGGERKRASIGNEIIINPSLLFLDEPTSGLDSTTAMRIIETLRDIAQVCAISSNIRFGFGNNVIMGSKLTFCSMHLTFIAGWQDSDHHYPPAVKSTVPQVWQADPSGERKPALFWKSIRSNGLLLIHRMLPSYHNEPCRIHAWPR